MELDQWVRAARRHANFSQEKLGEMLGRTKANVSSWETGKHAPSIEQLLKIAHVTGYPLPPEIGTSKVATGSPGERRIPLITYAQASGTPAIDQWMGSAAKEFLLTDLDLGADAFAFRVEGDSMLPSFQEGDVIIVDPSLTPRPGDFVLATYGVEGPAFRKYRRRGIDDRSGPVFELVPLNEDYPSIRSDATSIVIMGTMVEHRRYRRK